MFSRSTSITLAARKGEKLLLEEWNHHLVACKHDVLNPLLAHHPIENFQYLFGMVLVIVLHMPLIACLQWTSAALWRSLVGNEVCWRSFMRSASAGATGESGTALARSTATPPVQRKFSMSMMSLSTRSRCM